MLEPSSQRRTPAASTRKAGATPTLAAAIQRAQELTAVWKQRVIGAAVVPGYDGDHWLGTVPDVGPACEILLADRLFHDLRRTEIEGLLSWVRGSQDKSGAWLDVEGRPDLSLTTMGWWACVQAGDDPKRENLVRAQRVVHALGGAQRANFQVRLWLAMAGQISWSWLPAVPSELWLLPPSAPLSPDRIAPWARSLLTPYLLIAKAPARLHLADATPLLLHRDGGPVVAPRLTRPGLAGDLLQAFDRTVKLSRKFPRGPLPHLAAARAQRLIDDAQQGHGGWFSVRPTLLSLIALRVMGASSDDARIRRGLDYLRAARGYARIPRGQATGTIALCQGLGGTGLGTAARLMGGDPDDTEIAWLLRQELCEPGPWQIRADTSAGGWPIEAGGGHHLDIDGTCHVLDALAGLPDESDCKRPAWSTIRRATDVVLAMQEASGGFSRFERGEAEVPMCKLPWADADMLAFGQPGDEAHLALSARALAQLARTGFRLDDDRIGRGVTWVAARTEGLRERPSIETLSALASCAGALCPPGHPLRQRVEQALRGRQREDGSFGSIHDTAQALSGLVDLQQTCVQAERAARFLVGAVASASGPDAWPAQPCDGLGLSPRVLDPTAGCRASARALAAFAKAGGTLSEART